MHNEHLMISELYQRVANAQEARWAVCRDESDSDRQYQTLQKVVEARQRQERSVGSMHSPQRTVPSNDEMPAIFDSFLEVRIFEQRHSQAGFSFI